MTALWAIATVIRRWLSVPRFFRRVRRGILVRRLFCRRFHVARWVWCRRRPVGRFVCGCWCGGWPRIVRNPGWFRVVRWDGGGARAGLNGRRGVMICFGRWERGVVRRVRRRRMMFGAVFGFLGVATGQIWRRLVRRLMYGRRGAQWADELGSVSARWVFGFVPALWPLGHAQGNQCSITLDARLDHDPAAQRRLACHHRAFIDLNGEGSDDPIAVVTHCMEHVGEFDGLLAPESHQRLDLKQPFALKLRLQALPGRVVEGQRQAEALDRLLDRIQCIAG